MCMWHALQHACHMYSSIYSMSTCALVKSLLFVVAMVAVAMCYVTGYPTM